MESEKLNNWLKEGWWITCEVIGNQLKLAKFPTREKTSTPLTKEEIPQGINHPSCDFLNLIDEEDTTTEDDSVEDNTNFNEIPPAQVSKVSESEIGSHFLDEWLYITLNDNYTEFQARDNGKAVAMFIIHILSSTIDNRYYRFRDITYKKVIIFGVITEIFAAKKKTITVDDGTGQLKCYLEDGLNEGTTSGVVRNNDEICSESSFYEMNRILISKLKELSSNLPTFKSLDIGNRVCISGNISFHNGYFNLFVEKLERHEELKVHVEFMERVFYLLKNSYYSNTYNYKISVGSV